MNKLKKWDVLVIVVAVVAAGMLYFTGALRPKEIGGQAVIYVEGQEETRLNLNEDKEIIIETENGYNVVSVKDGEVVVTESDCRDKICVNHRPVSLVNESITCLPHKMIVEIENGETSDIDVIAK